MTDAPEPPPPPPLPGPARRLDAHSLRGLAHPLRMRLYELLSLDGPATATLLAQRLGENTGTVSWHLRHLAEHGFIEEDTARGTKRERWWRGTGVINDLRIADFRDDPDAHGALSVYLRELIQQYFSRVMTYVGEDWDERWRNAGTVADWRDLRMTPSQLRALNTELMGVIARHAPAADTAPDPEALPVVVQLQSFPRRERGGA
ncbi:winged helix-turn-helix domain-containing protein [Streptomyces coffeae]|uniref:Helix-turn-helix transcriptional regulator n=1 Tax=Streptomyces coffeae TaxID=621382 RepID=A0ABS1NBX8_9ACTN|nr:helix-turn-helix domain-containing protein [Streptomyces coffeae]MBL1097424.1 helix-turn-helix transcriptional regulator [Streptomyces coffeae]